MVRPQKLRTSTPQIVRKLWEAILYIRQSKQVPNRDRMLKYLEREHEMHKSEVDREINQAVKDNLLISYQSFSKKGSRVGEEQEGFRVPEGDFEERGDNDWYCFICHKGGEVLPCAECWRVYHPTCTTEDWTGAIFLCTVCKEREATRKRRKIKSKKLNTLLGYTIQRLKEKARELHQLASLDEDEKLQRLIYMPIDLNNMEEKVVDRDYRTLEEFTADAKTLLHNVVVVHGEYSDVVDLARVMIEDCEYDVEEIRKCQDCYFMSNAKPKNWFCEPCDPAHELLYAKLKGYSYWPAKVIEYLDDENVDVRFFGTQHQRAIIPISSTKSIECEIRDLNVKRTAGFMKAMEELKIHQELLRKKQKTEVEASGSCSESDTEPMETEDLPPIITSSRDNARDETPEEPDLVTSSEDTLKAPKLSPSMSTVSTQTKKAAEPKVLPKAADTKCQSLQTDPVDGASDQTTDSTPPPLVKIDESEEFKKRIDEMKKTLEKQFAEEKKKALDELEKRLRKDFEQDKQAAVSRVMGSVQKEVDKAKEKAEEKHSEEIKKMTQKHKADISTTKKKQWCYNCEEEAMYHCCWNTSYCSIKCQQQHWHKEHKKVCRRKR